MTGKLHAQLGIKTGSTEYSFPVQFEEACINVEFQADGPLRIYAQTDEALVPLGFAGDGSFRCRRRVQGVREIVVQCAASVRVYAAAEVSEVRSHEVLDPVPMEIASSEVIEAQLSTEEYIRRNLRRFGPMARSADASVDRDDLAFEDEGQDVTGYQELDALEDDIARRPSPDEQDDEGDSVESASSPASADGPSTASPAES